MWSPGLKADREPFHLLACTMVKFDVSVWQALALIFGQTYNLYIYKFTLKIRVSLFQGVEDWKNKHRGSQRGRKLLPMA
jgi:hypothetical protein